jgi:hypothetical protein
MTSATHTHEGAHSVAIGDVSVLVAPDGRTTARQRSAALRSALESITTWGLGTNRIAVATLVGFMVLDGITNLTVDGRPLLDGPAEVVTSVRLEVRHHHDDGTLSIDLVDLGA